MPIAIVIMGVSHHAVRESGKFCGSLKFGANQSGGARRTVSVYILGDEAAYLMPGTCKHHSYGIKNDQLGVGNRLLR